MFDRNRTVINKHIKNIYNDKELDINSTSAKIAQVRIEGNRNVKRKISIYNLDVIISLGYRVKSHVGIEFRKWASTKLKEYLVKGFAINERLLKDKIFKIENLENEISYLKEKEFYVQKSLTDGFLSIITNYSKSFELLSKFDSNSLSTSNLKNDIIYVINYDDVYQAILKLKNELINRGEASDLFGNPKDDSFKGILGSISQTVFGELAYPSIEEQAAQLLYSIIKGHAFSDGNKRIGSFVFVWFLEQNEYAFSKNHLRKINENTLVALALVVAQSLPEQRELMVKLIINLVKN
ncbi:virulence protein RhuM/Fic/DOC family protein [Aquimarina agarilytica]|uniref:virulence protein RhuM/Fic/DOC family protein n=1 Tax=Aquimarina agarilytica TaxID=1087449 RepID=UPI000287CA51|nr:virulence protein RhuM/Fic/DOC family protein [Aquimarina agarilytica]